MNIVTIKEVKGVVTCADDGTAEHVFNVKNATAKTLKVGMQLSVDEPAREEWLNIEGPSHHDLDVETMTQITVKIQVPPPPDCPAGKYSYRLRVFDPDSSDENNTDGDSVYFEVPKPIENGNGDDVKWWAKYKWRILAAIIAGVVLVAGIIFLIITPDSSKLDSGTKIDKIKLK